MLQKQIGFAVSGLQAILMSNWERVFAQKKQVQMLFRFLA